MPTKAEIEEYLEKHKIQAEIEKAIKEIVKDGMPPDPLKILAEKNQLKPLIDRAKAL